MIPSPRRIVVRGVNWLGDAVMTTPALQRLREAWPKAHLALLTPAKLEDLWRHHPALDAVIPFEPGEGLWSVARRLRRGQFDLAVILPNSPRAALEAFLAGIPTRAGYARPWRNWFLTLRVPPWRHEVRMRKRSPAAIRRLVQASSPDDAPAMAPESHHALGYLNLVAAVGVNPAPTAPTLEVLDSEVRLAITLLLSIPGNSTRWIALIPGAEYGPAKRWPAERFAAAAVAIHAKSRCGVLVLGGPRDTALAEEIAASLRAASVASVANLAGKTTLRELCAVLKLCRVVIANDSGPMHVAAALGTPVVALFGSTSPELTGPGWPGRIHPGVLRHAVACAPCFRRECPIDLRCLCALSVEQVVNAALPLLDTRPLA